MSRGFRTLKDRMLTRLTLAVRWVSGAELAEGLSTSQPAIEDALADLVAERLAEYDAAEGYRLNASELCQEAVRALQLEIRASEQKNMFRRQLRAQVFGDMYRIGVAEHRPGSGLVMYDLELQLPDDGGDLNQRALHLLAMTDLATKEMAYA